MDQKTFDEVAATMRIQPRSKEIARLRLVSNWPTSEIAEQFGVTRQCAHQAIKNVERAWRKLYEVPLEWETVTVALPPEEARKVRDYGKARLGDDRLTLEAFLAK